MTKDSLPAITAEDLWKKEWRRYQHTEPITKLLPLSTSTNKSNKLISISKDASVKVYRGHDFYPLQTIQTTTTSQKPTTSTKTTPVWPSDAALLNLSGHQRLVVSSYDRSLAFYNVLLAEYDPERPEERSCLGLGGVLKIPTPGHAATAVGSLPFNKGGSTPTSLNNNEEQEHLLVFGDDSGKVHLLKSSAHVPTMGLTTTLDIKTDIEVLHSHHNASVTQLLHVPHVGLLSSSLDGSIGIFDAERGRIAGTTGNLHNGTAVRCMAYHHPLTLAVSGGAGRSALLWHPRGDPGKSVGELPGHVHGVLSICAGSSTNNSTSEHIVITLSGTGTVTVFDLRTLRPLHKLDCTEDFPSHEDARPTALAFDEERQRLVTATKRPCAWSLSTGMKDDGKYRPFMQGISQTVLQTTTKEAAREHATLEAGERGTELEQSEQTKTSPSISCPDTASREKEETVWRQAYSHLRLATIPDAAGNRPR